MSQSHPSPLYSMTRSRGQTDRVLEQSSQRRSQFPRGTKDRECPPRCLVSLRKCHQAETQQVALGLLFKVQARCC